MILIAICIFLSTVCLVLMIGYLGLVGERIARALERFSKADEEPRS